MMIFWSSVPLSFNSLMHNVWLRFKIGQTDFQNLVAFATRFYESVWPILGGYVLQVKISFLTEALFASTWIPTNIPCVFHAEMTWKRSFSRRFNVEYTWCVFRNIGSRTLVIRICVYKPTNSGWTFKFITHF